MPLRVLVVGGPSGTGLARPDALIRQAEQLGITAQVTFLPPQPPQRLAQVYRASNLVAVPSYSESFGLVAIEAQACGTPVIAADVGGLGVAVRDEHTGVLVRGHDHDDWADALERLLTDTRLLASMATNAPTHARNFSWEHTAQALLDTYAIAMRQYRRAASPGAEPAARRLRAAWRLRRTGVTL